MIGVFLGRLGGHPNHARAGWLCILKTGPLLPASHLCPGWSRTGHRRPPRLPSRRGWRSKGEDSYSRGGDLSRRGRYADATSQSRGFAENGEVKTARQRFISTIPWGRWNTAEDVANAALFLASDEAGMVTGTAFEVDGGRDA